MTHYAYIDESGTQPEHQVMTVSLVLFDGRKAAERARIRILKQLYPHLAHDLKALTRKKLHFTDMRDDDQSLVAGLLAQEKIAAVINSHLHTREDEPHSVLFGRYTKMVQLLLYRALELTNGEMRVIIAQQGGFETYEDGFLSDVNKAAELFSKRNKKVFRVIEYQLRPAHSVCGLQLADFYAGTVRKMLIDSMNGIEAELSSPFDLVQHQINLEDFIDL
ncbi:MAG: DUF3800 domain-containing protein [Cyanobacteria bacterium HKST-UBA02]|nr:DUF3800 domain-containing protein [Cyanobacteria bacterium HKST-UBA02]